LLQIHRGALLPTADVDTREYRERTKVTIEQSIKTGDSIPEGWQVKREGKTRTRLICEKEPWQQLENKVWKLLFDLGAKLISTPGFSLHLKTREGIQKTKQLDVVAVDDDIAFVVECKARKELGPKDLKKDLAEIVGNMDDIRNALRVTLGRRDLRCVFVLATENVLWSDNDVLDARDHEIVRWDKYDILSMQELAQLAGEGAKYLVYNRVFRNSKIKNFQVKVPALKAKMGGRTFYSFMLSPDQLLKIAFVHHRTGDSRFSDLTDSYQRMINKSRVRQVEQFIRAGGFFPGSIIVNFTKPFVREDKLCDKTTLQSLENGAEPVAVTLPPYYGCAWIIDGQHRLYGFADVEEKYTAMLPVIAFVHESSHTQAKIFVDINKNQKAVPPDLLWDLYEDLYAESEDARERQLWMISCIAKLMNNAEYSPFRGSIKIPKDDNPGNLSLYSVCNAINRFGLVNPKEELLFHEDYDQTVEYAARRIAAFFDVLQDALPEDWADGDEHYLRTKASLPVLFGILRDVVAANLQRPKELDDIARFSELSRQFLSPLITYFDSVDPKVIETYRKAGGALERSNEVREKLCQEIYAAQVGFRSPWYEDRRKAATARDAQLRTSSVKKLVSRDESETLEFKGSLSLDVKRLLLGDGARATRVGLEDEGVLRSIVAMLNSRGGEVVVGVLEQIDFAHADDQRLASLLRIEDKLIIGLDQEYDKKGWDSYQRRLTELIESRIGPDVLDQQLVEIAKLAARDGESGATYDICRVSIQPSETRQYLNGEHFYVRRGNKTDQLKGPEIDRYWQSR
jgi:DGQHR domain-containing protein